MIKLSTNSCTSSAILPLDSGNRASARKTADMIFSSQRVLAIKPTEDAKCLMPTEGKLCASSKIYKVSVASGRILEPDAMVEITKS